MSDSADWETSRTNWNDGIILVEFMGGNAQSILSFDRPMSPDDPTDDAREVLMLGMLEGPWATREAAVEQCAAEARRLFAESY